MAQFCLQSADPHDKCQVQLDHAIYHNGDLLPSNVKQLKHLTVICNTQVSINACFEIKAQN